MANNAHRYGDPNTAGAAIIDVAQSTVYTNDLLQSVDGSAVAPHGNAPHLAPTTANGSDNVLAEDIRCNYKGNADTCLHERADGSPNVFINAPGSPIAIIDGADTSEIVDTPFFIMTEYEAAVRFHEEVDNDNGLALFPQPVATPTTIQQSIDNGLDPNAPEPEVLDEDQEPPQPIADVPVDCAVDIFSEPENHNFPASFQLSPNFTLGQLSSNAVLSKYPVIPQHGLTTNQIVCNLRMLCINVLEPLKAEYPNMIVTSGFRHGSSSSQHERGQAADVQLSGTTHQQQWDAAKVVKGLVPYDQFILELGNNYWFHLSYTSSGNRNAVLTRTKPGTYKSGLLRVI